jgi:hypothetical protein
MRRALIGARTLDGVPPRLFARRDSSSPRCGFRPGFRGLGLRGRCPPSPVPVQGCTSHPGHNAGRLMPKLPGKRTANPPRGHRPRCHDAMCLRVTSFKRSEGCNVFIITTIVKYNETSCARMERSAIRERNTSRRTAVRPKFATDRSDRKSLGAIGRPDSLTNINAGQALHPFRKKIGSSDCQMGNDRLCRAGYTFCRPGIQGVMLGRANRFSVAGFKAHCSQCRTFLPTFRPGCHGQSVHRNC